METQFVPNQFHQNCFLLNPDIYNINTIPQIDKKSIIEKINNLFELVGLFSSKIIGKDQFDEIIYSENDNQLLCSSIKSANTIGIYCPYDLIIHHEKNNWKMNCLNIKFNISYNIIFNHDFPNIFNIKRSNGTIQKAIKIDNDGLIIRKNSIYLRTHFNNNPNTEINESLYTLELYKDIPIQDIIKINKNIKNLNFIFEQFSEKDIIDSDNIRSEVMKYYNNLLKTWIQEKLKECINLLKNIVEINYEIKNFS
jgi:hypothetical protein